MNDEIKLLLKIYGVYLFASLIVISLYFMKYNFKECKQVGYSNTYCILHLIK